MRDFFGGSFPMSELGGGLVVMTTKIKSNSNRDSFTLKVKSTLFDFTTALNYFWNLLLEYNFFDKFSLPLAG